MYGNWKTKKNLKKKTYLNKNFYRDNNWYYYVLINRIKTKYLIFLINLNI